MADEGFLIRLKINGPAVFPGDWTIYMGSRLDKSQLYLSFALPLPT